MIKKIAASFLVWRISLFIIAFISLYIFPQFGNRFPYADQVLKITNLPSFIWGFGNFDGVHYLRIAQDGYDAEYSQAFFPAFPLLINLLNILPRNSLLDTHIFVDPSYFFTGIILSNLFFFLSLIFFYKLTNIDFGSKISFRSVVLLLAFPTSFYFGAIYTESVFLFLALGAIYFTRRGNFIAAGIFSAFASATRFFGLLLIPFLLIEIYQKINSKELKKGEIAKPIVGVLLAPFGTLLYMLYLKLNFEDPLYFLTSQPSFGAERTVSNLVFFPQVVYRYIKIFMTVPVNSQLFFNAALEFIFTITVLGLLVLFIKKIRFSYLIFTIGCLVLPTLTGTLSSMPRYALMGFLLFPLILQTAERSFKPILILSLAVGVILLSLFIRGYWVA